MLQPSALTPWEGTTGKRSCFQVSSVKAQDGSDVLLVPFLILYPHLSPGTSVHWLGACHFREEWEEQEKEKAATRAEPPTLRVCPRLQNGW